MWVGWLTDSLGGWFSVGLGVLMNVCSFCFVEVTCGLSLLDRCCKCEGDPCSERKAVDTQMMGFPSTPSSLVGLVKRELPVLWSVGELMVLPSNSVLVAADGCLWERYYDGLFYQGERERGMPPEFFETFHYPFRIVSIPAHGS